MDPGPASSRPNRVVVDVEAVAANAGRVREMLGAGVSLIACVKANAYGHGSALVACAAVGVGAAGVAVSDLEAAVALREAGVTVPLIVYPGMHWNGGTLATAAKLELIVTVVDVGQARAVAAATSSPQQVLLKVDVGHERLGISAEELTSAVAAVRDLRKLKWVGLLAHVYDGADSTDATVQWQLDRMAGALDALEALGALPAYRIAASSGPLSRRDAVHFDARLNFADPGRMLLGLVPPRVASRLQLRGALVSLESELIQVRELPSGRSPTAPYGRTQRSRVGIFPMGRADGLNLVHTGRVIVRDSFVPIIGEWIDHTTVALANVPAAHAGDRVVVIGSAGRRSITQQAVLSAHRRLRPVDVAMSLPPSVPRVACASARPAGQEART